MLGCHESSNASSDSDDCVGAKCDTPSDTSSDPDANCSLRQSEALHSSTRAFSREYVRWPCADVEGVGTSQFDDRGQEYCEYFAVFAPRGAEFGAISPVALGRRRSNDRADVTPNALCRPGDDPAQCGATLTQAQLDALEDTPDAVVGSCVFSSWHSDVPGPLPSCETGSCPTIHGFALDEDFARMKLETNSNQTASDVVQTCAEMAVRGLSVPEDVELGTPGDPYAEPFYRGCRLTAFFDLEWRRSDPAICAAVNRMVECGCSIPDVELEEIGTRVVPPQPRVAKSSSDITFRGFGLGSFDGPSDLPAGCRYADTGDDSQVLVQCDLLASDVLANLGDPKHACRETYGHQIVAHAPIPVEDVTCTTPSTELAAGCGDTPWNIGAGVP